jgi:Zn-dependent peptidase ImmA (M78 family)
MQSLLALAEKENIEVIHHSIPSSFLGLYIDDRDSSLIILDPSLKRYPPLQRCILAEELGHHFTSVGNTIHHAANFPFWKLHQSKTELKALKWSATNLIPRRELLLACRRDRLTTVEELADYFQVTPELMKFRLGFLSPGELLGDAI